MEKAGTQEKPLTRLHDMLVEEVSLVDRAANKRRFLLTKRGDEMSKAKEVEVVPDGKGALTAKPSEAPSEKEVAPAPASTDPAPVEVAKKAKSEDKADGAKPPFPGAAPPFKPEGEGMKDDEDEEEKRKKAQAAKEKAAKDAASAPDEKVQKRGAKMAKSRLEKFRTAVKVLGDVSKALNESSKVLGEVLKEIDVGEMATDDDDDEPVEGRKPAAKADGAVIAALEKATATVAELGAKLAKQQEQIEKLTKSQPAPTSIPVEKKDDAPRGDVSWPLDMNNPVDRDHVAKDVSFHDA